MVKIKEKTSQKIVLLLLCFTTAMSLAFNVKLLDLIYDFSEHDFNDILKQIVIDFKRDGLDLVIHRSLDEHEAMCDKTRNKEK